MTYRVVDAKSVASSPSELAEWLNAQQSKGWTVVTVDNGVIYLETHQGDVVTR